MISLMYTFAPATTHTAQTAHAALTTQAAHTAQTALTAASAPTAPIALKKTLLPCFAHRKHAWHHALTPSAIACATCLSLSMGLTGCQLTTNTLASDADSKNHNEYLTAIYSDLSATLGTFFPLGYTQFAVIDQQNTNNSHGYTYFTRNANSTSDSNSSNESTTTSFAASKTLNIPQKPEQALARALITQGANVCQSPKSCNSEAQKLTTTITAGPDYLLVELFAPEITLQRLYNKQAQALGPLSLYGQRSPLSALNLTPTLQHTANQAYTVGNTNSTTANTAVTAPTHARSAHSTNITTPKALHSPYDPYDPKLSIAPAATATTVVTTSSTATAAAATTTTTAATTTQHQEANGAKNTLGLDPTATASTTLETYVPQNTTPDHDSNTTIKLTTPTSKTPTSPAPHAPLKKQPTLPLGPLQSAQAPNTDADRKTAALARPEATATTDAARATVTTTNATDTSTVTSDPANAVTTQNDAATLTPHNHSIDLLATINREEQANILTNRYHFAPRAPTPIFFSKTKPSRYSHRSFLTLLP